MRTIKLNADIFDSEKIKSIESVHNADQILCLWLKILCKAKYKNSYGDPEFKIANTTLTDDVIRAIFRYNGDINNSLKVLEDNGFIKRDEKTITVFRWWFPKRDRHCQQYKDWRNSVFARDGYSCQRCGTKSDLNAHHIIHWVDCDDSLKYAVDNGITLCKKCHLEAHGGSWR